MRKSELKQIVKEEVKKVLKEEEKSKLFLIREHDPGIGLTGWTGEYKEIYAAVYATSEEEALEKSGYKNSGSATAEEVSPQELRRIQTELKKQKDFTEKQLKILSNPKK